MTDTGVLSYLNGLTEELLKLASWSQQRPELLIR